MNFSRATNDVISPPVILCFVSHYLPGFRSGGPVRTITNFVEQLGDEFDIRIVTRDRDALDSSPYANVVVDGWNTVGNAQVFYASSQTLTLRGVARLLNDTSHDILYLNSFFDRAFTGLPLLARRLGLASKIPCVIAPRGEFSQGAIALKAWKKRPYLWAAKLLGLYDRLTWQASSEIEAKDIHREFDLAKASVVVAPDLSPKQSAGLREQAASTAGSRNGQLRVVFLSRISPKKNLNFALQALALVRYQVLFTIYGPIEDPNYWQICQDLIKELPGNISVSYEGELHPDEVIFRLEENDLFFLPTRGENYGHVIYEALAAGLPVLISDQTPWKNLTERGVGWELSLDTLETFAQQVDMVATWSKERAAQASRQARLCAIERVYDPRVKEANRQLFLSVLVPSGSSLYPLEFKESQKRT
jgi:glycosyltransferase involved in cell wall biosynthesis